MNQSDFGRSDVAPRKASISFARLALLLLLTLSFLLGLERRDPLLLLALPLRLNVGDELPNLIGCPSVPE